MRVSSFRFAFGLTILRTATLLPELGGMMLGMMFCSERSTTSISQRRIRPCRTSRDRVAG